MFAVGEGHTSHKQREDVDEEEGGLCGRSTYKEEQMGRRRTHKKERDKQARGDRATGRQAGRFRVGAHLHLALDVEAEGFIPLRV